MKAQFVILSGSSNRKLALTTAGLLGVEIGECSLARFPDTEVNVQLNEPVRGRWVFILQSSSPPVDEHVMEVFAIVDACRRAGAAGIGWIAPYFGYARSDKRGTRRNAIMARLIADFAQRAGIDQLITVDLHSPQVEGFFRIPMENLSTLALLVETLKRDLDSRTIVVSPDPGRVKMAAQYAAQLDCPVAALQKERRNGDATAITMVLGDVRGRPCLVIDDMISTGGTINNAIKALLSAGAEKNFVVAASHPVFTAEARQNLVHPAIREIIVTDSIPVSTPDWPLVKVISLAPLLAEAVRRVMDRT